MLTNPQSIVTHIRDNRDYQCVSLQTETATQALKAAQKTGQRVLIVAETFGRKHIIFVAKDFKDDAWAERLFHDAQKISKVFSKKDRGLFDFVAPNESIASVARLSAAVNGCVYCCDEVLSCGSCRLFFYKV